MQREVKDLRDAVNSIYIPEAMQKEIIQNVKAGTKRKKNRFPRVAAALILLLLGTLSIPVHALVQSFLQARMEEMSGEEQEKLVDDLNHSEALADRLSRPYTEDEKRRLMELVPKYMAGTFPEGELAQAESVEEAERLGFCFLAQSSTFYLPDRELTEEELLQIIDFHAKRNYALTQYAEEKYGDEVTGREYAQEIPEQVQTEIVENGGITGEEALKNVKKWLLEVFGTEGDDLECILNYSENIPIAGKTLFYHVLCTDPSNRYSVLIDIEDGSVARARRYSKSIEKVIPDIAEAEKLLAELERSALSLAEEQLQLTCDEVYYVYYSVNDVLNPTVSFFFVQEDNSAFILEYSWDGALGGYQKSLFSTYEEEYETIKDYVETQEKYEHKGEEVEINIFFEKVEDMASVQADAELE